MGQNKVNRTLNWKKTKFYADTLAQCQDMKKDWLERQTKNIEKPVEGDENGKKA